MKRAAFPILLGLMVLTLPACAPEADAPIVQNIIPITRTSPPPTATIVWFPPSPTSPVETAAPSQPTPERKPDIGGLLLSDDFSSPKLWNPATSDQASINVSDHRLTIAVQPGVNAFRVRQGPALVDFYAEITARPSLCRDADEFGLVFRGRNNISYYGFALSCNGTAGFQRVRLNKPTVVKTPILSADVPTGAPGEVRLGVWVSGADMQFFLNRNYQFSVTDTTYASGGIGAFVRSGGQTPAAVVFSDLSVYEVFSSPGAATPKP